MSESVTEIILVGGPCDGQTFKVGEGVAEVITATFTPLSPEPESPSDWALRPVRALKYRDTGLVRGGKKVFSFHVFNPFGPWC